MGSHLELIRRLRAEPDLRTRPRADLAREFGTDERVVDAVLAGLVESREPRARRVAPPRSFAAFAAVGRVVGRILDAPAATTVGATVLVVILLEGRRMLPAGLDPRVVLGVLFGGLVLVYVAVALRAARFAAVWPAVVCAGLVPAWFVLKGKDPSPAAAVVAAFACAMIMAGILAPVAVLGAFFRMRTERAARRSLTRSQKLERVLEIQRRLEDAPPIPPPDPWSRGVRWVRDRWPVYAFLSSLILSSAVIGFLAAVDPTGSVLDSKPGQVPNLGVSLGVMVLSVLGMANQGLIGWSRPDPKRLWLGVLLCLLGNSLPGLVSLVPGFEWLRYGPSARFRDGDPRALVGFGLTIVVILAASLVATIAETRRRWRQQERGEPEALVAELLELEGELQLAGRPTAVLAVDVAGSTDMKRGADPVAVEWCFREYHRRLEEVARPQGGRVVSTAGDGAILSFAEPDSALRAAKAADRAMAEFNASGNRLEHPFRLRFGLHFGVAPEDLAEVQISRLIDVAAHLEGIAPVGGLAMSEEAQAALATDLAMVEGPEVNGHATHLFPSLSDLPDSD